ncbi:hypothetical protein RV134_320097 [Roseovarius sp. EC-HK134]|nr:hypothetical protein RV134_320097 [Roseovarius sp. EC-HK134]
MPPQIFAGKLCLNRARMQRHANRPSVTAPQFNRAGVDHLIQRRLGRAIAIPTAETIVANRPHPRRECGKDRPPLARQKAQAVLEHQGRPHAIERELIQHRLRAHLPQRLFRRGPGNFQRASRHQYQVKRPVQRAKGCRNRRLIGHVQTVAAARQARDRHTTRFQGRAYSLPDAARSADDQCFFHGADLAEASTASTPKAKRNFGVFIAAPHAYSFAHVDAGSYHALAPRPSACRSGCPARPKPPLSVPSWRDRSEDVPFRAAGLGFFERDQHDQHL